MGMYCEVIALPESELRRWIAGRSWQTPTNRACCSVNLEKSWHGLHYLLCGSVWEGDGPLAFLLAENEPVSESDPDSVPVRILSVDRVRQVDAALSELSDDALWSHFNPEAMTEQGVYPPIWDEQESDLRQEYLYYFHELKALVARAATQGDSLAIIIA